MPSSSDKKRVSKFSDSIAPLAAMWLRKRTSKGEDPGMSTDHHTKILASLVPDEIIYNVDDSSIRTYNVSLILGDVSGFTDLSEKFNKAGMGGPSRLTEILNNYIGSMVQEILMHDGDILKFSGDAFLAMWKVSQYQSIQDCVNQALDCALVIQKNYGRYETDVQVVLKVKLAIAAGEVFFSIIGNELMKHYAIAGKPIWDVKLAEYLCTSGDIMVSPSGWQHVNTLEYLHEFMPDGRHVKVLGMGPSWRNIQKIRIQKPTEDRDPRVEEDDLYPLAFSDRIPEPEAAPVLMALTGEKIDNKPTVVPDEFLLRPSMNEAAQKRMKDALRPFIILPVMRGVDMDEPLEYLTEMRQVVIVFINLITTQPEVKKLLSLVDESYQIVCRLVMEAQGCVNKVSLFDKDLMFLVIFGLRGYKHDLESQNALRCASTVRLTLLNLDEVLNASIGVTTGMTYCGVVGHSMRREYTVIGVPVNKAARLMVAYPGKVTCDRETFLHSKLEACHFILQEPKELKGLSSIGPIYEFKEQNVTETLTHVVCKFPLLSRADELNVFRTLLASMVARRKGPTQPPNGSIVTALLIEGEPRQGKSRLLDEMLYSVGQGIKVHRIALTPRDFKAPYSGIQLIFSPTLGISDASSPKEKEEKLVTKFGHIQDPKLVCSLNSIFNSNFDISDTFHKLNDNQRAHATRKMLRILYSGCFTQTWVIGIDDCEFLDVESWKLLPAILQKDGVLFVMTIGTRHDLCGAAQTAIAHPNVRRLSLCGIYKWYLAGLACQILDVWAIPPELEKIIHARSNGNPGWVESYLVSLIQAGGLIIRSVPKKDVDVMGLVSPPDTMIMRKESLSLQALSAVEQDHSHDDDFEFKGDGWKMYEFSYRGTSGYSDNDEQREEGYEADKLVAVCTLAPNFKLEDASTELTMDVMMLQMFDSLTSYEQLLLKCSSVLGEKFPRHMLINLMNNPSHREIALAIKRLFEVRILACASGDFTQNTNFMLIPHRTVNPNLDRGVVCDCQGLTIHESCRNLPLYASCGYIRFRMALFRETTYNLLTDHQKKDFHAKAIKYLERETRRCKSCGGGHFTRILDYQHVDFAPEGNMRTTSLTSTLHTVDSNDGMSVINITGGTIDPSLLTQINYEEMLLAKLRQSNNGDPVLPQPGRLSITTTRGSIAPSPSRRQFLCGLFGNSGPHKIESHISLSRSFSSVDFTNCQCPLILTTMYTQLLDHCRGTGHKDKIMDALLEYSAVCISSCNLPQAMRLLDDAQLLLTTKAADEDSDIPVWKIPYILGKIHTLVGYSRLELGQLEESYKMLHLAMKELGHPFPTRVFRVRISCLVQMVKQKFMVNICPNLMIGQTSGYDSIFADQMSECLSLLCSLFKYIHRWRDAKLAAVWSLNKALESSEDFYGMCTAYSNMMEVAHHYGNVHVCWQLENLALAVCHRKRTGVESQELEAVAHLYFAVFKSRLLRAEIARAINLGFKTLRIITTIHAVHLRLQVIPPMIEALSMSCRLSEAVSLLNDIDYASAEDTDKSGRVWFYAQCVDLQLNTGFTLLPFKKCEQFYQEEGESMVTIRDPAAERRYFVVMWLWSIRNEDWEAATVWYPRVRADFDLQPDDSLANVLTGLRILEGLLLYMVGKVDNRNIKAITGTYHEITTLMEKLRKAIKISKIALPRFMILKAYYRHIRFHDRKALKMLHEARNLAIKHNNKLEIAWAEHNEKVWNGTMTPILLEYWKEHCRGETVTDWHEADMSNQKMMLYSLPIPRYTI